MTTSTKHVVGSSAMATALHEHDWSGSPLGPMEQWPPELLSAVGMVLAWPTPMTLYWGPAFCLVYNDGFKQFLAEKHPHSLGAPAAEVWQEMWDAVQPDFRLVYDKGTPVVQQDVRLPVMRDGQLHEEWWTYTLSPLFQGGRVVGMVNVAENRTAAVLAQRKLAASEQRLAIALHTAQLGLWQLDLSSMRLEGSATFKAAFGRGPDEEFTYNALIASVHADDLERLLADVEQAMATGGSYRNEYRVLWPDGTEHWVLASGTLLPASATAPPLRVGVVLDVTERHATVAALVQSEKLIAVGRLASSIAHEINNPLEAVTNLIYLARAYATVPEVQTYLSLAERELQRVGVIANQTLRFHKQATNPTSCSCVDLISSALMIYEGKLVNAHVTVEKRKRANRLIRCFEGEIRQVLSNLIGNAIDAMSLRGGRLLLRSREGTDWRTGKPGIVLTVADTGGGMSPTTRQHLFEAFYSTKGINGTGLGLWISHQIVQNHQGTLRIRSSQSPRQHGTVFSLFLPFTAVERSTGS